MAFIDFTFTGSVTRAEVTRATNERGDAVDVADMPSSELAEKLNKGDLFISLGDYLYDNRSGAEIEIADFAASRVSKTDS